jgi:hypothetical protein
LSGKGHHIPDKQTMAKFMESTENKVINRIYGKGRGWSFSRIDFSDLGSIEAIDQSLSRLAKKGQVRRVLRGLYDYPKFSDFLKKELSPDIDQVARAIARKHGWTIQVSGNTALNILGLSAQLPGRFMYYSDGRSCRYQVEKQELIFKKSSLKDMGVKYKESALLVQAIKALDQGSLSDHDKQQIRDYFKPNQQTKILKDTRYVTSWVYEEIKDIFKEEK